MPCGLFARNGSLHGMALCTEWLFARNDVYLFIYSDVCGPGQRLECQSTLTGLLTGLLTGPGADRPELLAAVCGSGLALSRAWGQRGSVTNSSFSFNPYKINTHTAYMCWRLLVFEQRVIVTNSSFSFNPYNINTHTTYMCWRLLVFEQASRRELMRYSRRCQMWVGPLRRPTTNGAASVLTSTYKPSSLTSAGTWKRLPRRSSRPSRCATASAETGP